ncbi:GAP family protein [Homoserinimonas sp. OAct 916]|uniref:GAP family protein n=1 Tax=Homoserinimonas sp. OAct 916 TaxID=2211450 RepID=UPI00130076A3|nr:GAP family protein [Homoserinimonas sp. OAct 916]
MWAALGTIIPISLAVAISSTPIMAMLLILLSPNRNRSSLMFLIGWVLGLGIVVVAFTLFARTVGDPAPRKEQGLVGIALVVVGIATVVLGVVFWLRARGSTSSDMPKWLSAVGSLGPWSAFGLALVLNVRPKALLLSTAAGLSLRGGRLSPGETAIVVAVYVVIGASTVAVPIIATLISPERAEKWLIPTRDWITTNNRTISIVILTLVGIVIVASGLTRL